MGFYLIPEVNAIDHPLAGSQWIQFPLASNPIDPEGYATLKIHDAGWMWEGL